MNYAKIIPFDLANGNGIRISLFVSGCEFHCPGCFNIAAQTFNFGKSYSETSESKILKLLDNPYVGGLSILGGDPLWQDESGIRQLINLINKTHDLGKTVWLWSGFTWESVMNANSSIEKLRKELVESCDVFIDGPFEEANKDLSLHWRGSSNQRVINVKESLRQNQIVLYTD